MPDLIAALGLVLVIEGTLCALYPDFLRRAMIEIAGQPSQSLRIAGILSVICGFTVVYLVHISGA